MNVKSLMALSFLSSLIFVTEILPSPLSVILAHLITYVIALLGFTFLGSFRSVLGMTIFYTVYQIFKAILYSPVLTSFVSLVLGIHVPEHIFMTAFILWLPVSNVIEVLFAYLTVKQLRLHERVGYV